MKRLIQTSLGLAIGVVLVWVLFRGTQWNEVGESIRNVSVGWFLFALLLLAVSFPARVQRWSYICRADHDLTFRSMFSATQIGFLANFTLGGRSGEVIRPLVLSRSSGISFSKALAMNALDRVADLVGLIAIMSVAIVAYVPTSDVVIPAATFGTAEPITFSAATYRAGAMGTGGFLVLVIAAFVLLYARRRLVLGLSDTVLGIFSKPFAEKVHGILDNFADGLHVFRSPSDMAKTVFFSLVTWGSACIMLVAMIKAFHIECPWYTAFVMQAILSIFIAAPGAPGFIGQFHVPIVITLVMLAPDIDINEAKAVAILIHLIQLPPIAILGVYFLATEGVGLRELRNEGEKMAAGEQD